MIQNNRENSGRPNLSRRTFLRNAVLVLGGASLYALNGWKTWLTVNKMLPFKSSTTGNTKSHPPAKTGDISVGAKVDAVTQTIDSSGGYIAVSKAGDPLDGFVINVPANSYPDGHTFKVSYAPIISHTFGADINTLSPMINVDNTGDFSSQPMYVRVPVAVPDGHFAMGFIYNEKTKQLEGMPLVSTDAYSITVATRHFSDFFISAIQAALLQCDITTGFQPGVDDWEFTNYGSALTRGNCEGQCLSAIWYFDTKPNGTNARLYGRYDNNGNQPATPNFWQDDSLGYRLCSVVQKNIDADSFANNFWLNLGGKNFVLNNNKWILADTQGIGDQLTWDLFAYSMRVTNKPQLVCIWSSASSGHAMIVYHISQGNLYVADPNYPGDITRVITFAYGKFQPYNSGANKAEIDAGSGKAYPTIQYYAESTVMPWSALAVFWAQLKNGTVGVDAFPAYTITYMNDQSERVPLTDGLQTPYDAIAIQVESPTVDTTCGVYRGGVELLWDANNNFELLPGDNKLGILVMNSLGKYIDFQYIHVFCQASTTPTLTRKAGTLSVDLQGTFLFSGQTHHKETSAQENDTFGVPWIRRLEASPVDTMPVKWIGTSSFFGTVTDTRKDPFLGNIASEEKVSGVISADHKTLVSLDYSYNYSYIPVNPKYDWNTVIAFSLTLQDIPLDTLSGGSYWGHGVLTKTQLSSLTFVTTDTWDPQTDTRTLTSVLFGNGPSVDIYMKF